MDDIKIHENHIEKLLSKLKIFEDIRKNILDWYITNFWSPETIREFHKPFEGVMEVIRWFQMQHNTFVGLNTGRPESLRSHTLYSLNKMGKEYKVCFTNELLYMNQPSRWPAACLIKNETLVLNFQIASFRRCTFGTVAVNPSLPLVCESVE